MYGEHEIPFDLVPEFDAESLVCNAKSSFCPGRSRCTARIVARTISIVSRIATSLGA